MGGRFDAPKRRLAVWLFGFVLIDSSYLELMQQPTPGWRRWNALV